MFQLELKDPAEANGLISKNLLCPQTGIIFKIEDLRAPIRSSSIITAKISDTWPKLVSPKLNVSSVEKVTYIKDGKEKKQPKCANRRLHKKWRTRGGLTFM